MIQIAWMHYSALGWSAQAPTVGGMRFHRVLPGQSTDPSYSVVMHVLGEDQLGLDQVLAHLIECGDQVHWVIDQALDVAIGEWVVKAGARGYSIDPKGACERPIRAMLAGELWVPRAVLSRIVSDLVGDQSVTPPVPLPLSPREREVAIRVSNGYSNKRVARALGVTERTVKAHLSNIFQKTPASDRLELALLMKGQLPERIRVDLQ